MESLGNNMELTIKDALEILHTNGTRSIDIYYAELINDGETDWSVDAMCDPINDITEHSWTWTITSLSEMERMLDDDKYFVCADWEIITNEPFSADVVRGAIKEWMFVDGFDVGVRVIDVDDAAGSGYVKRLRDMYIEHRIEDATPLKDLRAQDETYKE